MSGTVNAGMFKFKGIGTQASGISDDTVPSKEANHHMQASLHGDQDGAPRSNRLHAMSRLSKQLLDAIRSKAQNHHDKMAGAATCAGEGHVQVKPAEGILGGEGAPKDEHPKKIGVRLIEWMLQTEVVLVGLTMVLSVLSWISTLVGNTTMKKEETTGAGGGIAASAEHQLTEVASRESEKAMATATANPCLVVRVFEAVQVGRARPQCKPKALETRPETSVPQP
jgi:hypothetical protein